jgi:4-hydroxybenzoate polyprenyltransferase
MGLTSTIGAYGRMVKFSHSIFALPFALAGAAFASIDRGIAPAQVGWILVAMLCARNAAMGFNRLADQSFDAANPRTAGRELPAGRISRRATAIFVAVLCAGFVFAASRLNALCFALSPVALLVILGYSYAKRFTWATQPVLGLALGIAPVGGWLAVRGSFAAAPLVLSAAVLTWVAGFDIIYACQDVDFDRRAGLGSIPARFGVARALVISRLLHVATVLLLASLALLLPLHPVYLAGVALVATCLAVEHSLVRASDLSRVNLAFFTANGFVSLAYLAGSLAAVALRP